MSSFFFCLKLQKIHFSSSCFYRKTIKNLEKTIQSNESIIFSYKQELKILKNDNANVKKLLEENQELKQKVEIMKAVEDVLSSTASEVEELIRNESDPRVLGVLVASLKRELKHTNDKRRLLMDSMKLTQSDHRKELDARR